MKLSVLPSINHGSSSLSTHQQDLCFVLCAWKCVHARTFQTAPVRSNVCHTLFQCLKPILARRPSSPPNKPRPLFKRCKSALIILQRLWKNLEIHSSTIFICFLKLLSNSVKFYFPWLHPVSKVLKEDNLPHYQMRFFAALTGEGVYEEEKGYIKRHPGGGGHIQNLIHP